MTLAEETEMEELLHGNQTIQKKYFGIISVGLSWVHQVTLSINIPSIVPSRLERTKQNKNKVM